MPSFTHSPQIFLPLHFTCHLRTFRGRQHGDTQLSTSSHFRYPNHFNLPCLITSATLRIPKRLFKSSFRFLSFNDTPHISPLYIPLSPNYADFQPSFPCFSPPICKQYICLKISPSGHCSCGLVNEHQYFCWNNFFIFDCNRGRVARVLLFNTTGDRKSDTLLTGLLVGVVYWSDFDISQIKELEFFLFLISVLSSSLSTLSKSCHQLYITCSIDSGMQVRLCRLLS